MEPFFLEVGERRLFALLRRAKPQRGVVLYLHPFGEEMHKSRRMAAVQARALVASGYSVLQIDLTGCGDSSEDFSAATWSVWKADASSALRWARENLGARVVLWGLRTGATLSTAIACEFPAEVTQLILWQPVTSGEQFINQFLRIKLAAEMMAGETGQGTKELWARLNAGEVIEVGGYGLSSTMAEELSAVKLAEYVLQCPVAYFELRSETDAAMTPANQRVVDTWRTAGASISAKVIAGDPFWQTQEIAECPALLPATLAALIQ